MKKTLDERRANANHFKIPINAPCWMYHCTSDGVLFEYASRFILGKYFVVSVRPHLLRW